MEKKGSIKTVAAVVLGTSLVGLLLSIGSTGATEVGSEPAAIIQAP